MIRSTREALPGIASDPTGVPEMKACPCGGSLAGRLLTGWESGPYSGRTVLECTDCGRREAIERRVVAPPTPQKNRNRRAEEVRACARASCAQEFHPKDYHSRQRYCSVDCGNKDRQPSARGAGCPPTYFNLGRSA